MNANRRRDLPAADARFALTPKGAAHASARALDTALASVPRALPILTRGELEAPTAPSTPKPRPRPRPVAPVNLDLDAVVDAAIAATLPALRAALRRELAAMASASANTNPANDAP